MSYSRLFESIDEIIRVKKLRPKKITIGTGYCGWSDVRLEINDVKVEKYQIYHNSTGKDTIIFMPNSYIGIYGIHSEDI